MRRYGLCAAVGAPVRRFVGRGYINVSVGYNGDCRGVLMGDRLWSVCRISLQCVHTLCKLCCQGGRIGTERAQDGNVGLLLVCPDAGQGDVCKGV